MNGYERMGIEIKDELHIYLSYYIRPWNGGAQKYGKFKILSIRTQILKRLYKFELHVNIMFCQK
jgi:hypothetical protein